MNFIQYMYVHNAFCPLWPVSYSNDTSFIIWKGNGLTAKCKGTFQKPSWKDVYFTTKTGHHDIAKIFFSIPWLRNMLNSNNMPFSDCIFLSHGIEEKKGDDVSCPQAPVVYTMNVVHFKWVISLDNINNCLFYSLFFFLSVIWPE